MNLKQQKQSNWFVRHKILSGILVVIAFSLVITAANGGGKQNSTSPPVSADKPAQSLETASATPQPETPKTWQKVIEVSGNNKKRTETFTLNGGEARIKYTVTGDNGLVYVYVMKDGQSLEENGGFAEVTADKSGSEESRLVKPAGKYYLDINGANVGWTVTIEELR